MTLLSPLSLRKADNTHLQRASNFSLYLVNVVQVLTLLQNVLSNKDVRVCKQDVHQLIDAVQALLPHLRLSREQMAVKRREGGRRTRPLKSPLTRNPLGLQLPRLLPQSLSFKTLGNTPPPQTASSALGAPLHRPHLHVCGQVRVVVIERGDDIELDLDYNTLPQVVFRRNLNQQLQQFNLGCPGREEKGGEASETNQKTSSCHTACPLQTKQGSVIPTTPLPSPPAYLLLLYKFQTETAIMLTVCPPLRLPNN